MHARWPWLVALIAIAAALAIALRHRAPARTDEPPAVPASVSRARARPGDVAPSVPPAPSAPPMSSTIAPPADSPRHSAAPPHLDASEADLMATLRALTDADPPRALGLADEIARRHPRGALADERALLVMHAYVHLGRIGRARDEALRFFEAFPASPLGEQVARLTGLRPRTSTR